MPALRRAILVAAAGVVAAASCREPEEPSPAETLPAQGELTVRAGPLETSVPLAEATCRPARSELPASIEAPGTERFRLDGERLVQPHHLTVRLPDLPSDSERKLSETDDWRATASLFSVALHGHDYRMMQFVAADVPGREHDPECRLVEEEESWRLTCSGATPLPWLGPGSVPPASFDATFKCDRTEK